MKRRAGAAVLSLAAIAGIGCDITEPEMPTENSPVERAISGDVEEWSRDWLRLYDENPTKPNFSARTVDLDTVELSAGRVLKKHTVESVEGVPEKSIAVIFEPYESGQEGRLTAPSQQQEFFDIGRELYASGFQAIYMEGLHANIPRKDVWNYIQTTLENTVGMEVSKTVHAVGEMNDVRRRGGDVQFPMVEHSYKGAQPAIMFNFRDEPVETAQFYLDEGVPTAILVSLAEPYAELRGMENGMRIIELQGISTTHEYVQENINGRYDKWVDCLASSTERMEALLDDYDPFLGGSYTSCLFGTTPEPEDRRAALIRDRINSERHLEFHNEFTLALRGTLASTMDGRAGVLQKVIDRGNNGVVYMHESHYDAVDAFLGNAGVNYMLISGGRNPDQMRAAVAADIRELQNAPLHPYLGPQPKERE